MAEHCKQCGAEILPSMRFCRFCGTPTGPVPAEETETQPFPSRPPTQQRAPSATRPVYLPPEPPVPYAEAPVEPPRRKRRWPWVLGFILGFLLLILGAAGYGIYRLAHTPGVEFRETGHGIDIYKDGERVATIGISGDAGASREGDVITRTAPLASGGTFAIALDMGDVRISTWDQDVVSIEGKRHLGRGRDRNQLDIDIDTSEPNTVVVRTKRPPGSQAHIDYEIKLPRQVTIQQVKTINGDVDIAGVQGDIAVETIKGDTTIRDVVGNVSAKSVSGDINVQLKQEGSNPEDMSFESVSGDITLRFFDEFNANLNISTTSGSMDIRGDLQVAVEDGFGQKTAQGRVGRGGGQTIHIRTVSGDIQVIH